MFKKVEIKMANIAIISCNNWQNKIEEDLRLQKACLNNGHKCEIISWENQFNNYEKYDCLILRSVWGYHDNYFEFKNWLTMLKENNIKIFNSVDIILDNIRKNIQFEILKKNSIPYIETKFITELQQLEESLELKDKRVFKPIISGSGDNTYIYNPLENNNDFALNNPKDLIQIFKPIIEQEDNGVMIQPFMNGINNGEYSCIYIDGINTHNMLRFPGVLNSISQTFLINELPLKVQSIADKISKLKEFEGYLYMRVDMVVENDNVYVMEIELTEPDLLTRKINDEKIKNDVTNTFVKRLEKRL